MRKATAVLGLVLTGVLGACGGGGDKPTKAAEATKAAVKVELIAFKPEEVAIKRGETVTWTQKDATVHTVTSGSVTQNGGEVAESPDGKFDSDQLAQGKTFSFTFEETGTFPYFCRIHPATMRGEVRVS